MFVQDPVCALIKPFGLLVHQLRLEISEMSNCYGDSHQKEGAVFQKIYGTEPQMWYLWDFWYDLIVLNGVQSRALGSQHGLSS